MTLIMGLGVDDSTWNCKIRAETITLYICVRAAGKVGTFVKKCKNNQSNSIMCNNLKTSFLSISAKGEVVKVNSDCKVCKFIRVRE